MAVDNIITIGKTSIRAKDYYPYSILYNIASSSSHHSESPSSNPILHPQNHQSNYAATSTTIEQTSRRIIKDSFLKRILIVDDEPDVTLTFKVGLEEYHYLNNGDKRRFEVYTYNSPLEALSEFKPHFYDLMLVDVYMPNINGFQLSEKILELDANTRVCFMSAADLNIEALRELYPKVSFGCFLKKPVDIKYLAERLLVELD